jgi:tetratricopeptide (TPR) repeat protein
MRGMIVVCSFLIVLGGCSGVNTTGGLGRQEPATQGKQLLDQQRYSEALAAYREAVLHDPRDAIAQYGLGVAYSRTGADDQAIPAYREAIRLQPDNVDAYYGLGVALERQGHDGDAAAAFREVIRRRPQDAMAYYGLGVVSGRQGHDDQAISAYREAVRLNPNLADAYYRLGVIYARLRQDDQAMAAYREVIRLQPGYEHAYYSLGIIYTKQGQNDQALEAYRQALRVNPNHARAYAGLGVVYIRARQNDQAMEVYQEALRLDPNLPGAHYGLWSLYRLKGEASEAQRAWRSYQALVPGAGPEPDDHFAQTETPESSARIAVAVLATQLLTEAPIVEASAPVKSSGSTLPEPPPTPTSMVTVAEAPRPSPERSADAATKPVPTVTVPEPPPTPAPAVTVAESPRPSPERSAEAATKPVPTIAAPEPPPPAVPAAIVPEPRPAPAPVVAARESPSSPAPRGSVIGVTASTASERRTALVIGNAAYRNDPLRNAVHDATDMASTLRQLGFEVVELHDAAHQQMEEGVEQFTRQLGRGGMGLFYFSGHGVQVNGQNYLIPVDARISRESDIKYQSVQVDWVLDRMRDAGNELNVIVLDACRNNPYARSLRTAQPGLAVMQAASGSLIGYATSPGTTAEDGPGRNGTYTKHLLHFMQVPGLKAEQMFKEVRVAVAQETGKKQIPWESTSLLGDFYFRGK